MFFFIITIASVFTFALLIKLQSHIMDMLIDYLLYLES